jgi:hypothetical protein
MASLFRPGRRLIESLRRGSVAFRFMKSLLTCLLLSASLPGVAVAQTIEQYAASINIAGRQRMLTQKMAKETLLVAAGVDAAGNRNNLKGTVELFKSSLGALKNGDPAQNLPTTVDDAVRENLDQIGKSFAEIEPVLKQTIDGGTLAKADVPKLANAIDGLIRQEELVVMMLSAKASFSMGKRATDVDQKLNVILDISGRQRMFSQKMAKDALLLHLGHNPQQSRLELKKTSSLFDKVLKGLKAGDKDFGIPAATDPKIIAQLDSVGSSWQPLYAILTKHAGGDSTPSATEVETIARMNVQLLQEANKVVELYQQSAGAAPAAAAPTKVASPSPGKKK